MQASVEASVRGRAAGLWVLAVGLGPLGVLEVGILAQVVGARAAQAINGAVVVLFGLLLVMALIRRVGEPASSAAEQCSQLPYRPEDGGGERPAAASGLALCCGHMRRLLIVHHTPSPAMQAMFESVVAGAGTDEIDGVEVVIRPALTAAAVDVLEADGYLLGTPANIGYMSGALKHFFDGIYYPCLEATRRRPYAPVRARRQRHRGSRPGGGGHRHRAEVAPRPAAARA